MIHAWWNTTNLVLFCYILLERKIIVNLLGHYKRKYQKNTNMSYSILSCTSLHAVYVSIEKIVYCSSVTQNYNERQTSSPSDTPSLQLPAPALVLPLTCKWASGPTENHHFGIQSRSSFWYSAQYYIHIQLVLFIAEHVSVNLLIL